jgi:prepilin-type N-terminal cleavage/methylation domain-containing protein
MNVIAKRVQTRGQGGFTLIELLVVVAILAILGGVAVFAVGNLTGDSQESACKVEYDSIKTAIAAAEATAATDRSDAFLDLSGAPIYWTITTPADPSQPETFASKAVGGMAADQTGRTACDGIA